MNSNQGNQGNQERQGKRTHWLWLVILLITTIACSYTYLRPGLEGTGNPSQHDIQRRAVLCKKCLQYGFSRLSASEKAEVHEIYTHDLTVLHETLDYRHIAAIQRGQRRIASEIATAMELVQNALGELASDPNRDPTGSIQNLIKDCTSALER